MASFRTKIVRPGMNVGFLLRPMMVATRFLLPLAMVAYA
jgi:hypothetical protein